ncbi:MAG: FAD-binding oxidoreductase, partial [Nitratireductor sp.]
MSKGESAGAKAENKADKSANIAACIDILKQQFGEQLQTSQALREQHAHTTTHIKPQLPDAVVFATSTQEVQSIVKTCARHNVPIIPFGTGTSLEGGVNAPNGGISVDVSRMDKILQVNQEDLDVRLQPGVTRKALNSYIRDTGLFFPIDPGADASLGGMAATRASGTNAVRYGTMRENVINITAVLANGEVIETSKRAKKSSAGYDLTRLMVGSEGTLGVITELTLKLAGQPDAIRAAVCSFPSIEKACEATIMGIQCAIPFARIELVDEENIKAINAYSKLDYPITPLLLLEFHGSESSVDEQVELFKQLADDCGGYGFDAVSSLEDRNKLWQARHDSYWAMCAYKPNKSYISTDVCVPISRLAECVRETQEDLKNSNLYGPIVGHVGDGNFHSLICFNSQDADEVKRMEDACARMAERALQMDGTCTGEHGIGQGKRKYMQAEH